MIPKIDGIEFPPVAPIFATPEEAHAELMAVVNEVCQQLKAEGQPIPEFKQFYRDVQTCWKVWRLYAPTSP